MKKKSVIWKTSDDDFIRLVKSCTSYSEILYKGFNLRLKGGNNKALKQRIKLLNIEIDHFKRTVLFPKRKDIEELLVENIAVKSYRLKNRLIIENLLENKCNMCGIPPFWNGKNLSLHLDHINGNNEDNRLENLRILCPNCHSQTPTYAGRNKKRATWN